jgi:hypothetical protein
MRSEEANGMRYELQKTASGGRARFRQMLSRAAVLLDYGAMKRKRHYD